jgi:predicted phosphodiesterase
MKHFYLIGDVHGKTDELARLLRGLPEESMLIQVGDVGFGFDDETNESLTTIIDHHKMHFIQGNHDDPYTCRKSPFFIPDGEIWEFENEVSMGIIGGAYSIDKEYRLAKGLKWFEDEELTYAHLQTCIDFFKKHRPDLMVTHDCPTSVSKAFWGIDCTSRTAQALQALFEYHQPKLWVFGHHHKPERKTINGTRFVCLGELEVASIEELIK